MSSFNQSIERFNTDIQVLNSNSKILASKLDNIELNVHSLNVSSQKLRDTINSVSSDLVNNHAIMKREYELVSESFANSLALLDTEITSNISRIDVGLSQKASKDSLSHVVGRFEYLLTDVENFQNATQVELSSLETAVESKLSNTRKSITMIAGVVADVQQNVYQMETILDSQNESLNAKILANRHNIDQASDSIIVLNKLIFTVNESLALDLLRVEMQAQKHRYLIYHKTQEYFNYTQENIEKLRQLTTSNLTNALADVRREIKSTNDMQNLIHGDNISSLLGQMSMLSNQIARIENSTTIENTKIHAQVNKHALQLGSVRVTVNVVNASLYSMIRALNQEVNVNLLELENRTKQAELANALKTKQTLDNLVIDLNHIDSQSKLRHTSLHFNLSHLSNRLAVAERTIILAQQARKDLQNSTTQLQHVDEQHHDNIDRLKNILAQQANASLDFASRVERNHSTIQSILSGLRVYMYGLELSIVAAQLNHSATQIQQSNHARRIDKIMHGLNSNATTLIRVSTQVSHLMKNFSMLTSQLFTLESEYTNLNLSLANNMYRLHSHMIESQRNYTHVASIISALKTFILGKSESVATNFTNLDSSFSQLNQSLSINVQKLAARIDSLKISVVQDMARNVNASLAVTKSTHDTIQNLHQALSQNITRTRNVAKDYFQENKWSIKILNNSLLDDRSINYNRYLELTSNYTIIKRSVLDLKYRIEADRLSNNKNMTLIQEKSSRDLRNLNSNMSKAIDKVNISIRSILSLDRERLSQRLFNLVASTSENFTKLATSLEYLGSNMTSILTIAAVTSANERQQLSSNISQLHNVNLGYQLASKDATKERSNLQGNITTLFNKIYGIILNTSGLYSKHVRESSRNDQRYYQLNENMSNFFVRMGSIRNETRDLQTKMDIALLNMSQLHILDKRNSQEGFESTQNSITMLQSDINNTSRRLRLEEIKVGLLQLNFTLLTNKISRISSDNQVAHVAIYEKYYMIEERLAQLIRNVSLYNIAFQLNVSSLSNRIASHNLHVQYSHTTIKQLISSVNTSLTNLIQKTLSDGKLSDQRLNLTIRSFEIVLQAEQEQLKSRIKSNLSEIENKIQALFTATQSHELLFAETRSAHNLTDVKLESLQRTFESFMRLAKYNTSQHEYELDQTKELLLATTNQINSVNSSLAIRIADISKMSQTNLSDMSQQQQEIYKSLGFQIHELYNETQGNFSNVFARIQSVASDVNEILYGKYNIQLMSLRILSQQSTIDFLESLLVSHSHEISSIRQTALLHYEEASSNVSSLFELAENQSDFTNHLISLISESQSNYTNAEAQLAELHSTLLTKADVSDLVLANTVIYELSENTTKILIRLDAIDARSLNSHNSLIRLEASVDSFYDEAVENASHIRSSIAKLMDNYQKTNETIVKIHKNLKSHTQSMDALNQSTRRSFIHFSNSFAAEDRKIIQELNDSKSSLDESILLLNNSLKDMNLTVGVRLQKTESRLDNMDKRALIVEEQLSNRILHLESILSPLVSLVTHMVRSARPIYSTSTVAVNSAVALNVSEGGRAGDMLALMLSTNGTKDSSNLCSLVQPDEGFVLSRNNIASIPRDSLKVAGTYRICYAAVTSVVTNEVRFWDQGPNVFLRVVPLDIFDLSPVNVSSKFYSESASYSFFSTILAASPGGEEFSKIKFLALVPISSQGCKQAPMNAAPVNLSTGVVALPATRSPGEFVLCLSHEKSDDAFSFRRQRFSLHFSSQPFRVQIAGSGFSRVVSGVKAKIILSGVNTSTIKTINLLDDTAVGCTGAAADYHQVADSATQNNFVINKLPGGRLKVCFSGLSHPTNDTDFTESGAYIAIMAPKIASLSPLNAITGEIIVGSDEPTLIFVKGAVPGDYIAFVPTNAIGCENATSSQYEVSESNTIELPSSFRTVINDYKVCLMISDAAGGNFFDQDRVFRVRSSLVERILPIAQGTQTINQGTTTLVAGTQTAFNVSGITGVGSLTLALVQKNVIGCQHNIDFKVTVDAQHNKFIMNLPLNTTNGLYTWCVSNSNAQLNAQSNELFLRHAHLVIRLVESKVIKLECINASSATITVSTPTYIKLHTSRTLSSKSWISFVNASAEGCFGAARESIKIDSDSMVVTEVFERTGTYKVCLSEISGDEYLLEDSHFLIQSPTLIVTLPAISSVEVNYADTHTVTSGVENDLSLTGNSIQPGDYVVFVPQSTHACSAVHNSNFYTVTRSIKLSRVILPEENTWKICHAAGENLIDSSKPLSPRDFTPMQSKTVIVSTPNIISKLSVVSANPDYIVRNSGSRVLVSTESLSSSIFPGDRIAFVDSSDIGCFNAVSSSLAVHEGSFVDLPRSGVYAEKGEYTICFAREAESTKFRRQSATVALVNPDLTRLAPIGASSSYIVSGAHVLLQASASVEAFSQIAILPRSTVGCNSAATSKLTLESVGGYENVLDIQSSSILCEVPPCENMKICLAPAGKGSEDVDFIDQALASFNIQKPDITGTVTRFLNSPEHRFTLVVPNGVVVSVVESTDSNGLAGTCFGSANHPTHSISVNCDQRATCIVDKWSLPALPDSIKAPPFGGTICIKPQNSEGSNDIDFVAQPASILAESSSLSMRHFSQFEYSQYGSARTIRHYDGYIYTVFQGTPKVRVVKADRTEAVDLISESSHVSLTRPWGFAVDAGNFYLSDTIENKVHMYTRESALIASYSHTWNNVCGSTGSPQSIDVYQGVVYCVCNSKMLITIQSGQDNPNILGLLPSQNTFDIAVGHQTDNDTPYLYFTTGTTKTGLFRVPNLGINPSVNYEWFGSESDNDINDQTAYDIFTRNGHKAQGVAVHKSTGHVYVVRVNTHSPFSMSVIKVDPAEGSWKSEPSVKPVAAVGDYLQQGRRKDGDGDLAVWSTYLGLEEQGQEAKLYLSQIDQAENGRSSVAVIN